MFRLFDLRFSRCFFFLFRRRNIYSFFFFPPLNRTILARDSRIIAARFNEMYIYIYTLLLHRSRTTTTHGGEACRGFRFSAGGISDRAGWEIVYDELVRSGKTIFILFYVHYTRVMYNYLSVYHYDEIYEYWALRTYVFIMSYPFDPVRVLKYTYLCIHYIRMYYCGRSCRRWIFYLFVLHDVT